MTTTPSQFLFQAYRMAWIASISLILLGCRTKDRKASLHEESSSSNHPTSSDPKPADSRHPKPTAPLVQASTIVSKNIKEFELGTPSPAVLGKDVMVVKTKTDELIISRLVHGQLESIETPFNQVSQWPVSLASGSQTHAYWISKGRLVRRKVGSKGQGPLEVLTNDAAKGTPVSASRSSGDERDVVLYVGNQKEADGGSPARLWVEGHGSRPMSREAGGATSVRVVHLEAGRFALFTLDGRIGMSPIHAISMELDAQGAPHLGQDRVVYVAGSAEMKSTLAGVKLGRGPLVLLPISRDTQSFGLLMLRVRSSDGEAPSAWLDYPNGMSPAPVAAANLCGTTHLAFSRPSSPDPKSARVVELVQVNVKGVVKSRRIVASAASIPHVDLWGNSQGGWLVYATTLGLRGQHIECK